ncbi:11945_t:CDS:1, partial [Funneliformis geosporum]
NIKMYMAIRAGGGVNPTVDDFFPNLKKCWVERQVGVSTFTQTNIGMQSQILSPNQALTIHAQKDLLAEGIKAL